MTFMQPCNHAALVITKLLFAAHKYQYTSISALRHPLHSLRSDNMTFSAPTIFAVVAVIVLVLKILTIGRRDKDYPPGPPTIPILGNIHQVQLVSDPTHTCNILTAP